jgi:hypothetical protein
MNIFDRESPVSRTIIYLGKLALFLAVPGLHLVLSGRTAIGIILLILEASAGILVLALSFNPSPQLFWFVTKYGTCYFLALPIVVSYLVADFRLIGRRAMSPPFFLVACIYAILSTWPLQNYAEVEYDTYLEIDQQLCPEICNFDMAVFEDLRSTAFDRKTIRQNDIVIYDFGDYDNANRVLALPGQTICVNIGVIATVKSENSRPCENAVKLGDEEFYVGEKRSANSGVEDHHFGPIKMKAIRGVNPVVVGNLSFLLSPLEQISVQLRKLTD